MQNFKDLLLWQEAHQFVLNIYRISEHFPKSETFAITSQLRRAAVSMPCNIAEGCGRYTQKDFANFLQIALGSTNESDYLTLLAKDLNYISEDQFVSAQEHLNKIRAMNINLIDTVRK
ncbi:MAG: four helix bundle protein [Bacteroidetes bacterium]|nr:four helix bundle protein [Bacteroidota bacterium]